ncbi:FecR domain-containing protein [uncultured Agitococcus sp.]|uniref:FecR domain-containing protein n=1 Tax=uncultured Agitococcus sp. TaxID=1506599 RepID=UPI00260AB863|nr:FecR domain-containing protein [uncultured Agitococcus sp.]
MLSKQSLLTSKGVLAALIGCLVSGQTIADVAGRVTFVIGDVTAISSNGTKRVLAKGELLNSGERLETGKGRLQIRFTDGSLLSLQPNTVFGLDNYTYARNKPQDGNLVFNFVRGGMRTISGAIGRVNRANYTVKTPAGTIGIRGTAYTATQDPNGRLLVTVNKGIVNIANDFGSRNIPTGQTFQMESTKAPEPAPAGIMAEVLANQPQPREDQNKPEDTPREPLPPQELNLGLNNLSLNTDFVAGEQSQNNGQPIFQVQPFYIQSVNGIARTSHFASLLKGTSGSYVHENILGAFDSLSADGIQVGRLVGLVNTALANNGLANNSLLLDIRHPETPLQVISHKQVGSLSLGEWTNGSMAFVDNLIYDKAANFSAQSFIPYIIGTASRIDLGNNQKVTYRLADPSHATPVRGGQNIGQLTKLNLTLDLNVQPLASLDMALSVDGVNYSVNANDRFLTLSDQFNMGSFSLNGLNDDLFAVASNDSCNNQNCPVNFYAFFSGNDAGALYEVMRKNLSSLSGAAILTGGTPTTIDNIIPVTQRLTTSLNNNYSLLLSNNAGINNSPNPFHGLSAVFNSQTGGLQLAYDAANDRINSFGSTPVNQNNTVVSAATLSQIQHLDKSLTWGVWSNGGIDLNNDSQDFILSGKQQVHYILGIPSNIPTALTSQRVIYSFVGGTTPSLETANTNATLNGQLANSSYLDFDFGANTVGLNLDINLTGTTNSLLNATGKTTLVVNNNIGSYNFDNLSIKLANGNSCNSLGCTGTASGFLAGQEGQLAALNYTISGVNSIVNDGFFIKAQGVAAFAQNSSAPLPDSVLANSNQGIYHALFSTQINNNPEVSTTLTSLSNASGLFDNLTGALKTTDSQTNNSTVSYALPTTVNSNMVSEVTHYKKTLSWGRWINSDIKLSNSPLNLGANDTVHYLIGIPTAQLPTSGVVSYLHAGSTTPTGTIVTPTTVGSPANTISPLTGFSVNNNSKITVDFASKANNAIKLDMNFNGGNQGNVNFQGESALRTQFTLTNLIVNQQNCQTCAATGFFAGQDASMIGVNYDVKAQLGNSTANMTGVAAFEK